jgi:uncharacterized cupredoxin-like copper-binding protein
MSQERRMLGVAAAGLVVVALTGCGGGSEHGSSHGSTAGSTGSSTAGNTAAAGRTIDVMMRDIAYEPTALAVKAGETVNFVFHNQGQIPHDAFLGDEMAQEAHEKEMMAGGGMSGHMGGDGIKVEPGQTGSLMHTFKPGETLLIGCHEAGHYAAGMKLALTVS